MELTELDKRTIRDLLKRQAIIHARKAASRHWCGGTIIRDVQGAARCQRCGRLKEEAK